MEALGLEAKFGEIGLWTNLSGETLISLEMEYVECFEKEFCELNDRIGNWVENESKSEVLRGENEI